MVSVTYPIPSAACQDNLDPEAWAASMAENLPPAEGEAIRQACRFVAPLYAGQTTVAGVPLLQHALGAASILSAMRMGYETVSAAILHAVPGLTEDWTPDLEGRFGPGVAKLVDGIARMEQIREFSEIDIHGQGSAKDAHAQAEGLRKMLLAMVEDVRVVLIKLAERTQTMRCLARADPAQQRQIAGESQGIFAPLANRLGVWQIKWELEDLSLRYLEPDLYKEIARLLDERRVDREGYIVQVVEQLRGELGQAGIRAEVSGRPKHIYSIVNKMKGKQLDFSELYDVRAVRVLVDDVKDCYTALGVVHNIWQPIPGEFDDYIAHPKSNDYRSLHTAVIGPAGKALEVQIRTFEMHQHAELGVAAHWRYKEGGKGDSKYEEKIAWLRGILEWKDEVADGGELIEQFKSGLFQDQVYVLTPQGKVIDMPKGSTPLDFAYHVHTDLGHRCRGARVDGVMVPLNYALHNGQRVEIIAAKQGGPSRDWLNSALGYLQSPRARTKVRQWFKYQNFEENVSRGRAHLDRELHRLRMGSVNQEKLAQKLGYGRLDDFLAVIGRGDMGNRQLVVAIRDEAAPPQAEETPQPLAVRPAAAEQAPAGILVDGVGNLLTVVAKCCKPVPPDPIVGYVTRGRGVTIHRRDCRGIVRIAGQRGERLVAASWGAKTESTFSVDIAVEAYDRQGLLRDISDVLVREKANVTRVDTLSKDNQARMQFTVEITGLDQLSRLLAMIRHVPNVTTALRRG